MNKIKVHVLNPQAVADAEQALVAAARLTQHGHEVHNMDDFLRLWNKPFSYDLVSKLCELPHPTLQKLGVINIVIVGASRRFLAQITRHQNEVKFMSASLQYSDMTGRDDFVVPYGLLDKPEELKLYLDSNRDQLTSYEELVRSNPGSHDEAAYLLPQCMRNTLLISATPYQWKHMIKQRVCRRNSAETRYVMLRCWEALYEVAPALFDDIAVPCQNKGCEEGSMSCGNPIVKHNTVMDIIAQDFPLLW